ncbi:Retrovirus-related Pol polyprotein from transposon opus [Nosema granulosis]|uniref:Retrovirus-related Pol polyprotein from transposon opus n=1 Tax=Nosema granulosis TaxID=83296 RepID=A0A9P6GWH7_9MICR|nr:Retrovirus-related Pol polyprotein from transposon opus [Nosema granulosis]
MSFLGLVNYYREFVPKFVTKTALLYAPLKGTKQNSNKRIIMNKTSITAFYSIRKILITHTERAQPNRNEEFFLTTDASEEEIGAILSQRDQFQKRKNNTIL